MQLCVRFLAWRFQVACWSGCGSGKGSREPSANAESLTSSKNAASQDATAESDKAPLAGQVGPQALAGLV